MPPSALALLLACTPEHTSPHPSDTSDPQGSSDGPTLLFASGFEDDVHTGAPSFGYQAIKGTDRETGFSWPIRILGSDDAGLHYIDHDHWGALSSRIETVTGHDGTPTRALYSEELYIPTEDSATQCPYEILDITEGRSDLTVRYWMKLNAHDPSWADTWRALFEWKSVGYADGDGFRLIAYVYTDRQGHPYWHWQGDADPRHPVWEIDNTDLPVPSDEWFLTEYYWRWSEGEDGVARWKINGELVGEHTGPTTRNGQPIDFIMLTQIYGDGNPKHQWVDDIEIWDGELAR